MDIAGDGAGQVDIYSFLGAADGVRGLLRGADQPGKREVVGVYIDA